jgi:hypothetical protein
MSLLENYTSQLFFPDGESVLYNDEETQSVYPTSKVDVTSTESYIYVYAKGELLSASLLSTLSI